jgi:hypothetical protein
VSSTAAGSGVVGEHGGAGTGVGGKSGSGYGVRGDTTHGFAAVHGNGGKNGVWGYTVSANDAGVFGSNDGSGSGVTGLSKGGAGVGGTTQDTAQSGVFGINTAAGSVPDGLNRPAGNGVWGHTSVEKGSGVVGSVDPGLTQAVGVTGIGSNGGTGVSGNTHSSAQNGVFGINTAGGTVPDGLNRLAGCGVWGHTNVEKGSGVVGTADASLSQAAAVKGVGKIAGQFIGDVKISGNLTMDSGGDIILADFAEDFDVLDPGLEPGTVMVIGDDSGLRPCDAPYDRRVAGVISGAGNFRPGIILGKQRSKDNIVPIALIGKVYCKVDAGYAPIAIGDLLTTSPTPGTAMKALDPLRALGSIIGKALGGLDEGSGLVPILVALQ